MRQTVTDKAALDAHDFQPECQWWRGCCETATTEVHMHRVDMCEHSDDTSDAVVDPYGDEIVLLCTYHCAKLTLDTAWEVNRVKHEARELGGRAMCTSCGAPLTDLRDVLRVTKPLPERGQKERQLS